MGFSRLFFVIVCTTAALCGAAVCSTAMGYQLKRARSGQDVRWPQMPVSYALAASGARDLSTRATLEAVKQAFAVWTQVEGAEIAFEFEGRIEGLEAGLGSDVQHNAVVFSGDDWPYGGEALALTTTLYRDSTGVMIDADIVLNERSYAWGPGPSSYDLRNALTHEVGHLLGFEHSEVFEATMYASAVAGETAKSTLHGDDAAAARALYPAEGAARAELAAFVDTPPQRSSSPADPGAAPESPPEPAPEIGSLGCAVSGMNGKSGGPMGGLPIGFVVGLGLLALRRRAP